MGGGQHGSRSRQRDGLMGFAMNDELLTWLDEVNLSGSGTLDGLTAGRWHDELAACNRELKETRDERDERDAPGSA